jgi:hypothetical protein
LHRKAVELSPLSIISIHFIWEDLTALGRYDEALIWLKKSLAVDPDSSLILDSKSRALSPRDIAK